MVSAVLVVELGGEGDFKRPRFCMTLDSLLKRKGKGEKKEGLDIPRHRRLLSPSPIGYPGTPFAVPCRCVMPWSVQHASYAAALYLGRLSYRNDEAAQPSQHQQSLSIGSKGMNRG